MYSLIVLKVLTKSLLYPKIIVSISTVVIFNTKGWFYMAIYGYCRISTNKQNIERQVRNILAVYPNAIIVKEVYTGTKFQGRKELDKILKITKPNDTIVFDSVSRMSRNSEEGCEEYESLFNKGITLVFLKEPHINTDVYKQALQRQLDITLNTGRKATDKFMNTIIEALNGYLMDLAKEQIKLAFEQAQKEVDDLHQRTKEGIETARLNGKQIGGIKGKKLTTKKSIEKKAEILKHSIDFGGTLKDSDCMKLTGLARNTFYKYKRELKEEAAIHN